MAKPLIWEINSPDPDEKITIKFSWTGDRSFRNRLIVSDAYSLRTVYDNTVETFLLQNVIPAGTLESGRRYYAEIISYAYDGTASTISDKAFFRPLSRPTFYLENLKTDDRNEVNQASLSVSCFYNQPNGDKLKEYRFYIYDVANTLLAQSDEMYDSDNIAYTFRGLDTSTTYYIQCKGATYAGVEVETPKAELFVYYENPLSYALFYAENVGKRGYVKYDTNVKVIQYNGDDTFEYINNDMIDLRDKYIYYDQGFKVSGDFSITLQGCYLWRDGKVLELTDRETGAKLTLTSYRYHDGLLRYKLTSNDGVNNYIVYSNGMTFTNFDIMSIDIRRVNSVCEVVLHKIGEYIDGNNLWLSEYTDNRLEVNDEWIDAPGMKFISKGNINVSTRKALPNDPVTDMLWFGEEV